jgi:hypothetical protein
MNALKSSYPIFCQSLSFKVGIEIRVMDNKNGIVKMKGEEYLNETSCYLSGEITGEYAVLSFFRIPKFFEHARVVGPVFLHPDE